MFFGILLDLLCISSDVLSWGYGYLNLILPPTLLAFSRDLFLLWTALGVWSFAASLAHAIPKLLLFIFSFAIMYFYICLQCV